MRSLFRSTFLSSSRFFSSVTIFWVGPVLVDGKIRWCWSVKVLQPFVVSDLLETFSEQTFICVVKKWNVVEKSLPNLLKWISWSFRVIRILFVIEETCNCQQQNEHTMLTTKHLRYFLSVVLLSIWIKLFLFRKYWLRDLSC